MLSAFLHWQLVLGAVVAGAALGVCVLAVLYLAPLIRLRLARDSEDRARVLLGELERPRRLGDATAVLEEHGDPLSVELRTEADLRALVLTRAVGREVRLSAPRRARRGRGRTGP